ncbi:retrovirus-related pol polyprotein from transposon TNT 1-94 [Tanacetum coccineum]
MNHNGTSVNTKLSKPSTSGTKLYSVTPLPKSKVIPKVVEKNDLSKSVTSHLTTNKIIEKCTKVLAPGLLKIESEPINAYFKNNRVVHRDYLKVTKEHVATLQELLEEARALKPLDEHIGHASKFAERIQELLVYVSASCPFTQSGNEKWAPATSHKKNNKPYVDASRTKQTIETITGNYVVKQNTRKTDNTMLPSTGRISSTNASRSKPKRNTKNDRIPQPSSRSKKNKVEAQPRKFKSSANKNNHVLDCNANVKNVALSKNSDTICLSYNELPSRNRLHTIRIPAVAPSAETRMRYSIAKNSLLRAHINIYGHPFNPPNFSFIVEIVLWYLNFGCSKHMTGHRDKLINFVSMFVGTVRFGNNHFAAIMRYGDSQMGNILISRVYYVEGLGHNLFSVGQFCDSDLEVAFSKHTCFVRNLEGVNLLSGSCGSNLYTISMADMMKSSLIFLLSKASKTKSGLWQRQLSHLNFGSINQLAKQGLVKGLPKLKYTKDHLIHGKLQPKADIGIFISYSPSKKAYQIYNKRTKQIMETMNVQFDELTQMASIQHGSGPELNGLTFRHISSELVLNQAASTSAKPPTKNDWDLLFQPMFDEYFKPLSSVSTPISAATLLPSDTAIASSSTSIDKDAPSPSTSPDIEATNSPINYTNVELHEEVT